MRLTISKIAELAGVSKTTVSRVLNEKPDVNPETREKIKTIISKYNFKPNAFAKAITHKKSRTIGLITPYGTEYVFSNPFYSEVLHGISGEIKDLGYYLMFCYADDNDCIDIFLQQRVDGFILLSPGIDHQKITAKLSEYKAPFVCTSKIPGVERARYIDIDNHYAATLALEHLVALGHRRIGIINSFSSLVSSEERLQGYLSVLNQYGIKTDDRLIKSGPPTFENGFKHMLDLLKDPELTGVFICSDMMAFGALEAAKKAGKSVPGDISIIGFDDIYFAKNYGLTTIKQPIFDKGKYAAKKVINMIEKRNSRIPKLKVELVVRQTTGKIE